MGAERKGTAETASASWYRTVTIPGFSDEEPRGSTRYAVYKTDSDQASSFQSHTISSAGSFRGLTAVSYYDRRHSLMIILHVMQMWSHADIWIALALTVSILTIKLRSQIGGRKSQFRSSKQSTSHTLPKAFICPGRISHTRLYPQFHAFSYSYLSVAVSVRSEHVNNWLLSVDSKSHWFPGFLSIDAGDHLGRESGSGLSQKLDTYLHSQGVSPNLFSYVYLVTQPKILGYKFAPASFWYLYTSSGQLGAIIAEVNNTFDERRAYFLPTLESITVKTEAATQGHHVCHPRHYSWNEDVVKIRWEKDFHVSPFSSRNGYYLLEARDILEHNLTLSCRHRKAREFIDITATLLSSDKRPKLIARLHSLGPPLRLDKMCFSDAVALVWNWWWPGLITYGRIVFEAGKLAFAKGMSIYPRPEPYSSATARHATWTESTIAVVFWTFFERILSSSLRPLDLEYFSSTPPYQKATIYALPKRLRPKNQQAEKFFCKILTPEFYGKLLSYQDLESLLRDTIFAQDGEQLVEVQANPEAFMQSMILAERSSKSSYSGSNQEQWLIERAAWAFMFLARTHVRSDKSYHESGTVRSLKEGQVSDTDYCDCMSLINTNQAPMAETHMNLVKDQEQPNLIGPNFLDQFVQAHLIAAERRKYLMACAVLIFKKWWRNLFGGYLGEGVRR